MTYSTLTSTTWTEATQAAKNAIDQAQSILIVTHVSPDGDAIGSLLGLGNLLHEQGKAVTLASDDGVPDFLTFLPHTAQVISQLDDGAWDVMVSVDASDEARSGAVGAYGRANSKTIINIDHHPTNTMFGDIHLVIPEAVSTTEVLFRWATATKSVISRDVAEPLLTGLVTDTLGFRTSNVNEDTLEIARALMAAGASLTQITAQTLDTRPFNDILLWKYALASATLEDGLIYTTLTKENYAEAGMDDVSDLGLSSFLVRVDEAMISAVFEEAHDGNVKISLRSKPGYDVAAVATAVGGGGHKQAAGATLLGPLADAQARVLPLLRMAVQTGELAIT